MKMIDTFSPSPQQLTVFDWVENGSGSAVIEAVAGSGKTTTLIQIISRTKGTVGLTVFNNPVAEEIRGKVNKYNFGDRVKVKTVHSLGLSAIKGTHPEVRVVKYKLSDVAKELKVKGFLVPFVKATVSMAKQVGIGIGSDIRDYSSWVNMIEHYSLGEKLPHYANVSESIQHCIAVMERGIKLCPKMVDYDDMVYYPIYANLDIEMYNWVLLDEAQDTNLTRRKLVKKMLTPGGRLVAVGDRHQSIFGFTGADCKSLDNVCKEFNAVRFPLTCSYRCPKKVIEQAHKWVNHIEATEDAPDGTVDFANVSDLIKTSAFSKDDVVLCRNTRPLVELAFKLRNSGIPCKVEGLDYSDMLIGFIKGLKVDTIYKLKRKLEEWYTTEFTGAMNKKNYSRCDFIEDRVETLRILIKQCKPTDSVESLIERIPRLFVDTVDGSQSRLTLSTIHRAKGKEWGRVFVLDMDRYSPSKWARKDWELEQEDNLCYVQVTRAKNHLTFIKS